MALQFRSRLLSSSNWEHCKKICLANFSSKCSDIDKWVPEEKVTHTGQPLGRGVNYKILNLDINCQQEIPSLLDLLHDPKLTEDSGLREWDKNDYRLARFVDRPKHVNPNFAIDLINEAPPEKKKDRIVSCDGGGPLGHPKVYINLDKPGNHTCGYCGLRFYKENH